FEHGNSKSGCGVTHSHVHLTTTERAVSGPGLFGALGLTQIASLAELVGTQQEVFWARDSSGLVWAALGRQVKSQYGRRCVASANAFEHSTDWKAYTHAPWFESS